MIISKRALFDCILAISSTNADKFLVDEVFDTIVEYTSNFINLRNLFLLNENPFSLFDSKFSELNNYERVITENAISVTTRDFLPVYAKLRKDFLSNKYSKKDMVKRFQKELSAYDKESIIVDFACQLIGSYVYKDRSGRRCYSFSPKEQ